MKIGLCGGALNIMYVFARAFAKQGLDVCFIRERGGQRAFNQPVWEDAHWTLSYGELSQTAQWSWEDWAKEEQRLGWKAPAWLFDPLENPRTFNGKIKSLLSPVDTVLFNYLANGQTHWRPALTLMNSCDILLVCGIEETILALASGKPFIIWPHGGDIRTAAGLHPPKTRRWSDWKIYLMVLRLLRLAYKQALWIATHAPDRVDSDVFDMPPGFRYRVLPIPLPIRPRLPKEQRRRLLSEVLTGLGQPVPDREHVAFLPSRVSFYWKGTDRFLQALARLEDNRRFHLIVSGWGKDYERAQQMVTPGMITFLPCAVSKPILYDFFSAMDLVVDQFVMGTYGLAAIEAMSTGAPVMMWIDDQAYLAKGWQPPPVLNARSENDILDILTEIVSGEIDLEAQGRAMHDWVRRTHGEEVVVPRFVEQCRIVLPGLSRS